MKTGRPKKPLNLAKEEHEQLRSLSSSRSLPHGLVRRVRIVLMAADGLTNRIIAEKLDLSHATVGKWRMRYLEQGLAGLHDELRPGCPRSISDEQIATLIRKTLNTKPKDAAILWGCI